MRIIDWTFRFHDEGGDAVEYLAHEQDITGDPAYYGFVNEKGGWVIMRQAGTNSASFRYAMGRSDFATSWIGKGGLSYQYLNELFA